MKSFHSSNRSGDITAPANNDERQQIGRIDQLEKSRWERLWPSFACGAGLFSDGYLNSFGSIFY